MKTLRNRINETLTASIQLCNNATLHQLENLTSLSQSAEVQRAARLQDEEDLKELLERKAALQRRVCALEREVRIFTSISHSLTQSNHVMYNDTK
jgi:hypothetical protein